MEKSAVIGGLILAALALNAVLLVIQQPSTIAEDSFMEDVMPEPDPADLQPHMVYCIAPWGQLVAVYFSAEEWQMVNQLSKMSGEAIETIVCDIAAARHANRSDGMEPGF